MLAQLLAAVVALGSVTFYMAAFFFPEVHRRRDFVWSGIGFFYALVLWLCAGRLTGGVLLGQVASVSLIVWLGSQTLLLRRQQTAPEDQTAVPPEVKEQVKGFSFGTLLAPLTRRFQRPAPAPSEKPEAVATLIDEPPEAAAEPEAESEADREEAASASGAAAAAIAAPDSEPTSETEPAAAEASMVQAAVISGVGEAAIAAPRAEADATVTTPAADDGLEAQNWPEVETSNWPEAETSNWPEDEPADAGWVDAPDADANWPDAASTSLAAAATDATAEAVTIETANWVDEPETAIEVEATVADAPSESEPSAIANAEPVAEPEQALAAVPDAAAIDSLDELPLEDAATPAEPESDSDDWDKDSKSAW